MNDNPVDFLRAKLMEVGVEASVIEEIIQELTTVYNAAFLSTFADQLTPEQVTDMAEKFKETKSADDFDQLMAQYPHVNVDEVSERAFAKVTDEIFSILDSKLDETQKDKLFNLIGNA